MRKKIIALASLVIFVLTMAFTVSYFTKEAYAESQNKKMPANLDDDCYDTGGNCADVVIITPDPDDD